MDSPPVTADGSIGVLLIEDDPADVLQVQRTLGTLGEFGQHVRLEPVSTLGEGLDVLGKAETDVLLLDLHLPDSRGVGTVVRVRERDRHVPIVVFTSAGDDRTALGALRAGAQDYLPKSELDGSRLRRAIRYALERRSLERRNQELQEQLLEARNRESLAVFALGMAHGFNTAIGTILDHVDDALPDCSSRSLAGPVKRHLLAIRQAALGAGKLTEQIREYAAAQRPESHPVDLSSFVFETSEWLEKLVPKSVELRYDMVGNLPPIRSNTLQLRQALIQLVVNALEALPDKSGLVSITTGSVWADRELLARTNADVDLPEGPYGFVEVRDSGRAIEPEVVGRIFDPFFTTKYSGRGLGLAAVLGIVRQHQGAVKVESTPDEGTTFTLFFPCANPATRPVRPRDAGSEDVAG